MRQGRNVFNDIDGGNVNNSSGVANSVPSGLNANLVDANSVVVATVPVNADGTYSFPATGQGDYTVSLSTNAGVPGSPKPAEQMPAGWAYTGEFNGVPDTGTDPAVNGISEVFTVAATDVTNINFGIQGPPVAADDEKLDQPAGTAVTVFNILANDTDFGGVPLSPDNISLLAPPRRYGYHNRRPGTHHGFHRTG
ncbi:hypothetical protein GCM10023091_28750 [Ravibacter arvi]|uniref:SD-repeat containing protein B domain-containing protein n=1 Tax=Ravibacter arvi TaxID=2051041 RepID=A0ABP8M1Q5_9BACT